MAQEFEIARIPVTVSFDESALYTETYGFAGTSGTVFLEGQRLLHPWARQHQHPLWSRRPIFQGTRD